MEAVAKMKDSVTDAYIRGHQYVCGILVSCQQVILFGIRLYIKKELYAASGFAFRKTTELAARLIREFQPPAGIKVMVLFYAYYLYHTVVKPGGEKGFHFASTLKSNRSLFKLGWKRQTGRYGKNLFRRRRTTSLGSAKLHGSACYRCVDAGWLKVSTLGPLHVVFSRKGWAHKILASITDEPNLSVAGLIQAHEKRWAIEQFVKDAKQLLGLGEYQNRSYWAAVIHLHVVCFAYALLTHLHIMRQGAQDQRTLDTAAGISVALAQELLRRLIWDDLLFYLKRKNHGESVLQELERLRVA
jgi:hypothetical protein